MNLENEASESVESTDVPAESSSAPAESAASSPETKTTETASAASDKPDASTPFHEHPRFKELIEQKNQEKSAREALEKRLGDYERQMSDWKKAQEPAKPVDPVIAKLKDIDPEFADYIANLKSGQAEFEQMKQWRDQQERQQTVARGVEMVKSFHDKHKVSPDLQTRYNREIDLIINATPGATLNDLPAIYGQVHDSYQKFLDGIKRAEREAYTKEKTSAGKTPASNSKGKAVSPNTKFEWSKNPDEAKSQAVKRILDMSKKSNSL